MKRPPIFTTFACFVALLTLGVGPLIAQVQDAEAAGRAAEEAGRLREALEHYSAAHAATTHEYTAGRLNLDEKIVDLVLRLDPKPALPEEAERHMIRGKTALETASGPEGIDTAGAEFFQAHMSAPSWADPWFNLGVIREKQKRYLDAIYALRLYLRAAPAADDAKAVKEKIYALEYLQEQGARELTAQTERRRAEEAQAQRDLQLASRLAGTWRPSAMQVTTPQGRKLTMHRGYRLRITADGRKVTAQCIGTPMTDGKMTRSWYDSSHLPLLFFSAEVKYGRLVGTINGIAYGETKWISETRQLDEPVEISSDGLWFKLGVADWNSFTGNDWDKFWGRE
ncbi:MAG: hypothetical protein HYV75_04615 [Opitutae bacterium]|nr:hypothetical protein [Opitutae bacterium]